MRSKNTRRFKVAIILGLAMIAGCSMSASITKGADTLISSTLERDDFRRVHNATVRIRAYEKGSLSWMGTGSVYKIEDGRLHILSNNHVCNGADKITAEFRVDGRKLGEFVARVDLCVEMENVDIGLISLVQGTTLKDVPFVPIVDRPLNVGDEAYWVGCDAGNTQNGQIARILHVQDDLFFMNPKAIGGDSGSSVVQFDENGNPEAVGLIAWVGGFEGEWVAMAQPSKVILGVLADGESPDLGETPPSGIESDLAIKGLLERLREMREDNKRERQNLIDRISGLELSLAMENQQTQLFRDRWNKQQEDNINRQDHNDGMQDKIMGQFTTLKQIIKFAKWSFYAMIAALVASIFFGQGWATRIIVTVFKVVFNCIRGTAAIVMDALSRPLKKTNGPMEALDNLREEIGLKEDAP